jgi:hypothetical protein
MERMRWIAVVCLAVLVVGCDAAGPPSADPSAAPQVDAVDSEADGGGHSPEGGVVNGRIVSAGPARRPPTSWCPDCDFSEPHRRAGDVALYLRRASTNRSGASWLDGITVVGPRGTELRISCPEDFPCLDGGSAPRAEDLAQVDWQTTGWGPVILGPADDEISMISQRDRVDVWSFEGRVVRSVRLRGLAGNEVVLDLAWSPDGSRLAVATSRGRMWIFGADGRRGEVAYTSRATTGPIYLEEVAWSPTGDAVSALEGYEFNGSVYLVVLGPGAAKPRQVYWWPSRNDDDRETYVWSPDGRRIAVGADRGLLELSADDGRVLDRHRSVSNPVWLARSR